MELLSGYNIRNGGGTQIIIGLDPKPKSKAPRCPQGFRKDRKNDNLCLPTVTKVPKGPNKIYVKQMEDYKERYDELREKAINNKELITLLGSKMKLIKEKYSEIVDSLR